MREFEFDFFDKNEYVAESFIVHSGNFEAFCCLNQEIEEFKCPLVFLSGAKKSGKTYMATLWKQKYNAKIIDNSTSEDGDFETFVENISKKIEFFDYYLIDNFKDNFDEQRLLFLINCVFEKHSSLLIVSNFNFADVKIKIKDLKSRVKASIFLKIGKLPEEMRAMFLLKLLNDRKIFISSSILKFLMGKLPNNYEIIYNLIGKIEMIQRESGGKLTLDVVKAIM
jgi:chromosomal replication initiation ATPase DnaA